MVGIRAFGAYIPKYRLAKETVGWGSPVERAIANYDEDSVTMAVAAGIDCLGAVDRQLVDGLLLASTTPIYFEKLGAATAAAAMDLRRDIFCQDVSGTLRAGTSAIRAAADAVKSGSAKNVLVAASDCRIAYPKSDNERNLGDGAAALLISDTDVIAEIEAASFLTDYITDTWRATTDTFVKTGEDRFIMDEGYQKSIVDAMAGLMKKADLTPKDFAKVVYYSPDGRRHNEIAKRLGLAPTQVQDPLFGKMGNTGAAFPLMLLVAALEDAKPGDRILLAGYGDGADAYILRVTDKIMQPTNGRRAIKKHLASKSVLAEYDQYLRWRGLLTVEPARRPDPEPISLQASWREQGKNVRLLGARCKGCGRIQYPQPRVCSYCHTLDKWEPVRLSDKKAEIVTYSMDYVAGTPDVPLVITVVNFDGGGRFLCMLTDREVNQMKVGLPVEMTFRKLGVIGGVHNYHWKATPIRA